MEFNADLKNLFAAAKATNSKTNFSDAEKKLLEEKKSLFDVNGDGKFNQNDIDMFVKGDVNGDGTVSADELNFVAKYKDYFAAAITEKTGKTHKLTVSSDSKAITDTEYDNNNKVAKKTCFNHTTGSSSNVTYTNGVKTRQVNTTKDGTVNTYTFASDGKTITGCVGVKTDGSKVTYTYKNGVKESAVKVDKKGNKIADYTYFTSGDNAGKIKTKTEDDVISTYTYYADGDLKNVKSENKKTGKTNNYAYTYEVAKDSKTGETTKITKRNGVKSKETITSKDGKTVTEYNYNSKGQKISGTKDVEGGTLTKYEYKDGKISEAVTYENGKKKDTFKYLYETKDGITTRTTTKNGVKYQTKETNSKTGTTITTTFDDTGKNATKKVKQLKGGSSTTTTYDGNNTTVVKKDKNGKVTEKTVTTKKDGVTTSIVYDANNKMKSKKVTNKNKSSEEIFYDSKGIKTKQINISKDGDTHTYTYENDGKTIKDCKGELKDGSKIDYKYKNGKRVSARRTSKDGKTITDYTYQSDGKTLKTKIVSVKGKAKSTKYTYDLKGNKLTETEINNKVN